MKFIIKHTALAILFVACNSADQAINEENENKANHLDSTHLTNNDSTLSVNSGDTVLYIDLTDQEEQVIISDEIDHNFPTTHPNDKVKDWKNEDFIIECKASLKDEVIDYIEYLKIEWADVPSPFVATYAGNEFGDYFHLMFKISDTLFYDFGDGNNDFGKYQLYEGEYYNDNPKYLNKKFKVYWTWKESGFACCSGSYSLVRAYIPSITQLELVKN